jgi:hypothetical protein
MSRTCWTQWVVRQVRAGWRALLHNPVLRKPAARRSRREGALPDGSSFVLHTAKPEDYELRAGPLHGQAMRLCAEARQRFERGELFRPLPSLTAGGVVVTFRVTERSGADRFEHLLAVMPPIAPCSKECNRVPHSHESAEFSAAAGLSDT